MTQLTGQPIFILPEGASRILGRDAQRSNISVAIAVANAVRSTLGPKGMDKMLVDDLGDIVVTNDGATILEEMNVEHPAAKMMVEVAKTQDDEVGDGTTTAVVLSGELLREAGNMIDKKIHPSVIVRGYNIARDKCLEVLDQISEKVGYDDNTILEQMAMISMTGKGAERIGTHVGPMIVKAVKQVAEKVDGKVEVDTDFIKVEKKQGGDLIDTKLITGVVIDKERVHTAMPKRVKDAKIALIDSAIEIKDTETDAAIRITSPDQLQSFLDQEESFLRKMVEDIKNSGANVMFCQKGIDDVAQHFFAKAGIFAVRRVKKSDMEKLARATGATIVTKINEIETANLGNAGSVEERKIAGDEMVFVEQCVEPKAVTLLVRGGSEHVIDEAERAIQDAIGVVSSALEDGRMVIGGGAVEVEMSLKLRNYSKTVGGREQLAIEAFATALEAIPRTLAESAGMDSIDTLVDLRAKHENGDSTAGVDVNNAKIANMKEKGVVEPAKIKSQAVSSATEVAEMILRIDDIISSGGRHKGGGMPEMPGGMPPGMGM